MDRGSAAIIDQHCCAYFMPAQSNIVYQYNWQFEAWKQLPSCPFFDSALVNIDGSLTAVGGVDGSRTNKLFTLENKIWLEKYPPMKTVCFCPAVVSTSDYVIVIGGIGAGGGWTVSVKLLQVKSKKWYELMNTPHPLTLPSATICDNQLYVISGETGNFTGYWCSLEALPSSDKPITSPHLISWQSLPPIPVQYSTLATLNNQLLIIGGSQDAKSSVNSIHQLVGEQWVEIGSMLNGRWFCLTVSPSLNKIIIVGGKESLYMELNTVEECIIY